MTKSLAGLTLFAIVAVGCCRATPASTLPLERPQVTSVTSATTSSVELVRDIRRVVVNITSVEAVRVPDPSAKSRFITFRHEMEGAGFILDPAGHIVTNAHLVAGASTIRVQLWDEREVTARVVAIDSLLDVAILSVDAGELPAAALASSESVQIGEPVLAIGNPFGFKTTVTSGIVSAKSRAMEGPLDDFIQTDAPINPGNSGGPLFNRRGEVVGINTSIALNGQGIGFAVPIDALREVLPQLLAKGYVERGDLAFELQAIDAPLVKALHLAGTSGALVSMLEPGGPADRAGVHRGDVVVALDGVLVRNARQLELAIARHAPGSRVELSLLRDGKSLRVTAETGELDPDEILPPAREASKPRGFGVDLVDDRGEVLVRDVAIGSPLDGRIERGDRIVEIDGVPARSPADVELRWNRPGQHLLWIRREGVARFVGVER